MLRPLRPVTLDEIAEHLARLTRAVEALRPTVLVSVNEAARRLGVTSKTVRRRIRDGKLPVKRIGRAVRVDLRGYDE